MSSHRWRHTRVILTQSPQFAESFRAPKDLEARIDRARKVFPELDGPEGAQILDEWSWPFSASLTA